MENLNPGYLAGTIVADMFRHSKKTPTLNLSKKIYNALYSPGDALSRLRGEFITDLFDGVVCDASDICYNVTVSSSKAICEELLAVLAPCNIVVAAIEAESRISPRMLEAYANVIADCYRYDFNPCNDSGTEVRIAVFFTAGKSGLFANDGTPQPYKIYRYLCPGDGIWLEKATAHLITSGERISKSVDQMQRTREKLNDEKNEVMERMEVMNIERMEGVNCSYHLKKNGRSRRCDIDRLARDYPEAYRSCVTENSRKPYLIVSRKKKGDK